MKKIISNPISFIESINSSKGLNVGNFSQSPKVRRKSFVVTGSDSPVIFSRQKSMAIILPQQKQVLGTGNFGTVQKAIVANPTTKNATSIAVKSGTPDQLTHEMKMIAKADSPWVLPVVGQVKDKNGVLTGLSFPVADYGSLKRYFPAKKAVSNLMELVGILHIVQQLLYALESIHKNGVIHRDIRLANLLRIGNGQLRLGDFGISGEKDKSYKSIVMGVFPYIPPETVNNRSLPLQESMDVWQVGVLLMRMALGKEFHHLPIFYPNKNLPDPEKGKRQYYHAFYTHCLPVLTKFKLDPSQPSTSLIKIAQSILVKNPQKRPSVSMILEQVTQVQEMILHHQFYLPRLIKDTPQETKTDMEDSLDQDYDQAVESELTSNKTGVFMDDYYEEDN